MYEFDYYYYHHWKTRGNPDVICSIKKKKKISIFFHTISLPPHVCSSSSHYSLCEVSVETEGLIKQKRLPDQLTGLPDRIHMSGRYYIKNNMSTEPLVPDEMMADLLKDSATSFLQLNSAEVAAQLTLRDFQYFNLIEPTEYMDDLFELESTFGEENLQRFSEVTYFSDCTAFLENYSLYGFQ